MKKLVYILLLFCFHFSYSQNFNSFNRDPNFNNFTLPIGHNFINENVIKSEEIKFVNQRVGWENYQIASRHDIDMLLEKIYIYFEKNEPSHPAPLFIRRIQRLMNYNFYEIMKDISPDSLDRLEILVGQPFENNIDN